ncbi:MAG: hypothetical protein GX592_04510 [Clostridiales bacterium]|nr:hypothetical protein [Clostridiales bacterium]
MRSGHSRFVRLVLPMCLALALLACSLAGSGEPLPTPTFPPISFTTTGNSAFQQYMEIALGEPIEAAMDAFGEPTAVYGQDSYVYRAIAGAAAAEPAIVFRFRANSLNFECIASALDGRILKKQVSSPGAFHRLLDSASALVVEGGTPYSDLYLAAGVEPYLWMSFLAPNTDDGRYDVCLWPDSGGQLVAVVRDGVVQSCEYQPIGIVLPAAAVDAVTPRAPRYLAALPENGNDALASFTAFMKFATLRPGQSGDDVIRVMGLPTREDTGGGLRTLSYEYPHGGYATGRVAFSFTVADDDSQMLVAKGVEAFPLGEAEVRARYAPQMLPGMAMEDILRFMGDPLTTNQSLSTSGGVFTAHSYTGHFASVSAVFASDGDACLWHEVMLNDSGEEALTLYEEYVLLWEGEGEPGADGSSGYLPEVPPGPTQPEQYVFTPEPTPSLPGWDDETPTPWHRRTPTPRPRRTPTPTPRPTSTFTPNRTPSPSPSHEVTPRPPTPRPWPTIRLITYLYVMTPKPTGPY